MTRYDSVPGHPLAGVPQATLNVARAVLGNAQDVDLNDTDERNALADHVVLALLEEGYLGWLERHPDRESLVLAVMQVQRDYASFQDDEDVSFAERVVDALVLPLLQATRAGGSPPANRVDGTVTGTVIQAGDVGSVQL